jgi:hypothetical protein
VVYVVENISYHKVCVSIDVCERGCELTVVPVAQELKGAVKMTPELAIVQDADRLDAIGGVFSHAFSWLGSISKRDSG